MPFEYLPATGAPRQHVVLLHGWGCNREVWRPLLAHLRPWANVTLLDIPGAAPGCGSDTVPGLPELLTGILGCCPPKAVYVGWSLGGQLAIELAAQYPQRVQALITLCSNPRFVAEEGWPGMDADEFRAFTHSVATDPTAALQRFDTLQVTGSSRTRGLLRQLRSLRQLPPSDALLAGLAWLATLDARETLSSLDQPRLHLLAEDDALVPYAVSRCIESRIAGKPAAHVAALPHTSHLAPLEVPQVLAVAIEAFLEREGTLFDRATAPPELEKKAVAASFSRAATRYDSAAGLQRDVGEQLLAHLDELAAAPRSILDLGCGTGYFCPALRARYPEARYLGLDIASGMVDFARSRCPSDCDWLVADAESLPLASDSIDLVFSSLAVQWCARPEHLFAELARVLRPGGRCVFTTLGPQTLYELRSAWAAVDAHQHVNTFLPAVSLLAAAGGVPGMALRLQERDFRMDYGRVRDLLDELKALGAHNMNRSRPVGLTSRRALQGMLQAYEARRSNGVLPATYAVIFGVLKKL
ncbi:MAG: malonyl-ACP O-methyltransferase BioC [Haliea sp.]|nr:malonyl-ACP O-methyltransferase BioC [Haliea sp.]